MTNTLNPQPDFTIRNHTIPFSNDLWEFCKNNPDGEPASEYIRNLIRVQMKNTAPHNTPRRDHKITLTDELWHHAKQRGNGNASSGIASLLATDLYCGRPSAPPLKSITETFGTSIDLPVNAILYDLIKSDPEPPTTTEAKAVLLPRLIQECAKYKETAHFTRYQIEEEMQNWLQVLTGA